jgi:hypothetical protein
MAFRQYPQDGYRPIESLDTRFAHAEVNAV